MAGITVPIAHIRSVLDYDAGTGELTRRVRVGRNTRAGERAGAMHHTGYRVISIHNQQHREHRVVWAHYYGEQPPELIDHINGDRADNRIVNLRTANWQTNAFNKKATKSVLKGTTRLPSGRWQASIGAGRKRIYLGCFDCAEEAHASYRAAAEVLHGEFARFE